MKSVKAFVMAACLAVSSVGIVSAQSAGTYETPQETAAPKAQVPTFVWTVIISAVFLALANDY